MARSSATWTPEQARAMAVASRSARIERARLKALLPAQVPLEPAKSPPPDFASLSLARVRAHVHNMHQVISCELTRVKPDAQRLNWLAAALERLAELERRLAGRPMPGTLKPRAQDARPAQPASVAPVLLPQPAAPAQPDPPAAPSLTEAPEE